MREQCGIDSKTVRRLRANQNIDSNGFVKEKSEYGYYNSTNKLAVPEMLGLGSEVDGALSAQARNYNPVGTVQSAQFKIKSVAAKAKNRSFTINVKKKVTEKSDRLAELEAKEAELEETVKLVGMDAISDTDRLKMEAARSIREDFLHQAAFHEVDTFTSPKKQLIMMKPSNNMVRLF